MATKIEPSEKAIRAINTINLLYPPDSQYPATRVVGRSLLQAAQENVAFSWEEYPEEVLVEFARLCEVHHQHS